MPFTQKKPKGSQCLKILDFFQLPVGVPNFQNEKNCNHGLAKLKRWQADIVLILFTECPKIYRKSLLHLLITYNL